MVTRRWIPLIGAFAAGTVIAVQGRLNGGLSTFIGNGVEAALVSFGSGLVILVFIVLLVPSVRRGVARIPAAIRVGELNRWHVLGGLIGGAFIGVQSIAIPIVGVAVFTVAVVAGQSTNSLFVDKVGLGPAGKQPITWSRAISALIAVVAVAVAVSDRFTSGGVSLILVAVSFVGGLGVAVQQAINGRVSNAARNPISATFYNFFFGTAILAFAFAGAWVVSDTDAKAIGGAPWWLYAGGAPWWLYAGGALGVILIAIAAWAVPKIGVLAFALVSISGQLSGALVIDVVAPTTSTNFGWHLVAGVLIAFLAVALGARGRLRAN